MTGTDEQAERRVKGSVLIDYLKIVRGNPDKPWADYLPPEDMEVISQMVLPSSWYPLLLFQRMGVAIFDLVSGKNREVVRAFGRGIAERIAKDNPGLVARGSPPDTVKRYLSVQDRFYSFKFFEIECNEPSRLTVNLQLTPDDLGADLLAEVLVGTLVRLIELAGGVEVRAEVPKDLEGAQQIEILVSWKHD